MFSGFFRKSFWYLEERLGLEGELGLGVLCGKVMRLNIAFFK